MATTRRSWAMPSCSPRAATTSLATMRWRNHSLRPRWKSWARRWLRNARRRAGCEPSIVALTGSRARAKPAPMDASNPVVNTVATTSKGNVGVLLVNLGTPDTADARGVRVYLREFLSDPRVIENQGLVWKLILNGVILQTRPRRKARDYRKIWNTARNESPLKTITRAQAEKLSAALDGSHIVVDWAMRYGNPSVKSGIDALMQKGCDRILVVPLYPQYSASTTATV